MDPVLCIVLILVDDYTPTIPCTEYSLSDRLSSSYSSYSFTIGDPVLQINKPALGEV